MIRSLSATEAAQTAVDDIAVRRNLNQTELAEAYSQGDLVWLDITEPTTDELDWLANLLDLHPAVVADLNRVDRRPNLLVYPTYIFLSLFEPELQTHKVEGKEIHCLVAQNGFITVRMNAQTEVDAAYNRVAQQNPDAWKRGVPYLLYLTIQYVIDAYYPLLDRINLELNSLEEMILTQGINDTARTAHHRIKQQLVALRQMVAPQREVLSNILGEEGLIRSSDDRDMYRHLYERLLRVYDLIDSQHDTSRNILDLIQSYESAKLADAVRRLTIISMIFLPLTFIAALLELNFITPQDSAIIPISGEFAFILLVLMMSVIGGSMAWFFNRKGWL